MRTLQFSQVMAGGGGRCNGRLQKAAQSFLLRAQFFGVPKQQKHFCVLLMSGGHSICRQNDGSSVPGGFPAVKYTTKPLKTKVTENLIV